jgi:hypothetical protein
MQHHGYNNGGCKSFESIGVSELARRAGTAKSTVSKFFNDQFNYGNSAGYRKYRAMCAGKTNLIVALKLLNSDFTPSILYGGTPPQRPDSDDE